MLRNTSIRLILRQLILAQQIHFKKILSIRYKIRYLTNANFNFTKNKELMWLLLGL